MILSKKFECTNDDLDSVIVSVAKEIEDVYIDCDGRCLNCDYYEPITNNCRVEED
jgi:hypothetical protein